MTDYYFNDDLSDEEKQVNIKMEVNIDKIDTEEHWMFKFGVEEQKKLQNDPLYLLMNKFFGYLSTEELLTGSLVCKQWQHVIGKLKVFSSRTKLIYSSPNNAQNSDENILVLINSKRFYEDIEISVWNQEKERKIAEYVITKHSNFLKHLKLVKFGGHNTILNKPLNMPHLKELEVQVIGGRLSGKFFEQVTTLERLVINGVEPKYLGQWLQNNAKLKELTLYQNAFISYFKKNIMNKVKCQLEKLKILDHIEQQELRLEGELSAEEWSNVQEKNFLKFLSTQNNLNSLHLDFCNAEFLPQILSVSSLELLEINKITGDLPKPLVTYNNIETFLTNVGKAMTIEMFETFLLYIPNIQSLYIHKIHKEDFQKIIGNRQICVDLQNFYYFWAYDDDEETFLDLRKIYHGPVNVRKSSKEEFINIFGP